MIMQIYKTIQEENITGLDNILVYLGNNFPIFIIFLLVAIFFIVTLGVYLGTRKFGGQGDFFAAAMSGSFLTSIAAAIMTIPYGIISLTVITPIFVLTIIIFVLFMIKRNRD